MKNKYIILLIIAHAIILEAEGQLLGELIDLGTIESYESFKQLDPYFEGKSIVLLGEQSHREGTTLLTKYELIKYLHEVHDFDLLVFESDFYGGQKAWQDILGGAGAGETFASSIFFIWSATKGFQQFSNYVEDQLYNGDTLQVLGFDSQLSSKIFREDFNDVISYIKNFNSIDQSQKNSLIETISLLKKNDKKALKKKNIDFDISTIDRLLSSKSTLIFEQQSLLCLKSTLMDRLKKKSYLRDKQMANNLQWIKNQYPNKKIICFGATSHFLYNSEEVRLKGLIYSIADNFYKKTEMMGDYLKDEYGDELYSIGFTAVQGDIGGWFGGKSKSLKSPIKNSLEEKILNEYDSSDYFMDLSKENQPAFMTRPIGNVFMKNPASKVMDALIINYNMKPIVRDKDIYCKTFTNNIWICPENKERIKNEGK